MAGVDLSFILYFLFILLGFEIRRKDWMTYNSDAIDGRSGNDIYTYGFNGGFLLFPIFPFIFPLKMNHIFTMENIKFGIHSVARFCLV